MRHRWTRKFVAVIVVAVFTTQISILNFAEASLWQDRKKTVQLARLPVIPAKAGIQPFVTKNITAGFPIEIRHRTDSPWRTFGNDGAGKSQPPLSIPPTLLTHAAIKNIFYSKSSPSAPLVVLLQDIHAIEEAQFNIAGVLDSLAKSRDKKWLIAVEGSAGAFRLKPYRSYLDLERHKSVAAFLLRGGLISGAEYFGMVAPEEPLLWGVEKPALYQANVRAYRKSLLQKPPLEKWMNEKAASVESALEQSLNPELKTFVQKMEGYENGSLSLSAFVAYLTSLPFYETSKWAELDQFKQALSLEASFDFRRLEHDQKRFFKNLIEKLTQNELDQLLRLSVAYKSNQINPQDYYTHISSLAAQHSVPLDDFGSLKTYFSYLNLIGRISAERLLEELDQFKNSAIERLVQNETERRLVRAQEELVLFKKMVNHSLSPAEWGRYKKFSSPLVGEGREGGLITSSLIRKPSDTRFLRNGILSPSSYPLPQGEGKASFETFYRTAFERNDVLVEGMLEKMREQKLSSAVLIAGGFHTPGIEALLKQKGISFVTLAPKIKKVEERNSYLDVFATAQTPLEKLLLGDRFFLSQPGTLSAHHIMPDMSDRVDVLNRSAALADVMLAAADNAALEPVAHHWRNALGVTVAAGQIHVHDGGKKVDARVSLSGGAQDAATLDVRLRRQNAAEDTAPGDGFFALGSLRHRGQTYQIAAKRVWASLSSLRNLTPSFRSALIYAGVSALFAMVAVGFVALLVVTAKQISLQNQVTWTVALGGLLSMVVSRNTVEEPSFKNPDVAEKARQGSVDPTVVAQQIREAFSDYYGLLSQLNVKIYMAYLAADLEKELKHRNEKHHLYPNHLTDTASKLRDLLGTEIDQKLWEEIAAAYKASVSSSYDRDLAMTYFYSIERRLFPKQPVEYGDDGIPGIFAPVRGSLPLKVFTRADGEGLDSLITRIFRDTGINLAKHGTFENIERDSKLAAALLDNDVQTLAHPAHVAAVELLQTALIRDGVAYQIGRVLLANGTYLPVVFSIINSKEKRQRIHAVLTHDEDIESLFDFALSPFSVVIEPYRELVSYLQMLMPAKDVASLYAAFFPQPAKVQLIRQIRERLKNGDLLSEVKGREGMDMISFKVPSLDYVFKLIKGRPRTSRQEIQERYQEVSAWPRRTGKIINALRFRNVVLPVESFSRQLMQRLTSKANEQFEIIDGGRNILFYELYVQPKTKPKDKYVSRLFRAKTRLDRKREALIAAEETDKLQEIEDLIDKIDLEIKRVLTEFAHMHKNVPEVENLWIGDARLDNSGITRRRRVPLHMHPTKATFRNNHRRGHVKTFDLGGIRTLAGLHFERDMPEEIHLENEADEYDPATRADKGGTRFLSMFAFMGIPENETNRYNAFFLDLIRGMKLLDVSFWQNAQRQQYSSFYIYPTDRWLENVKPEEVLPIGLRIDGHSLGRFFNRGFWGFIEWLRFVYHEYSHKLMGRSVGIHSRVELGTEPKTIITSNRGKTDLSAAAGNDGLPANLTGWDRARLLVFYLGGLFPVIPIVISAISGFLLFHVAAQAYQQGAVLLMFGVTLPSAFLTLFVVIPTLLDIYSNWQHRSDPRSDWYKIAQLLSGAVAPGLGMAWSLGTLAEQQLSFSQEDQARLAAAGIEIVGDVPAEYADVLTADALLFAKKLHDAFGSRREELLRLREERQAEINRRLAEGQDPLEVMRDIYVNRNPVLDDKGKPVDYKSDWRVDPVPADFRQRWVEITGPAAERKGVIYRNTSGADVDFEDYEDSQSPVFKLLLTAYRNVKELLLRVITFGNLKLKPTPATSVVRFRGWHLPENHVLFNGKAMSGGLFDLAMHMHLNQELFRKVTRVRAKEAVGEKVEAEELAEVQGAGPYFYLPKIENHWEAKLWNDAFNLVEQELGLTYSKNGAPKGIIKATVLIETFPAVFQMEQILYQLRDHSGGLNAGRWDYLFSFIKTLIASAKTMLPNRGLVTMASKMMLAYVKLLIWICHKHGAFAMGGMSAIIPGKDAIVRKDAFNVFVSDEESADIHRGLTQKGVLNEKGIITIDYLDILQEHGTNLTAEHLGLNAKYDPYIRGICNVLAVSKKAMEGIIKDKEGEVSLGHDGAWVAHPDLVAVIRRVFEKRLARPNQIDNKPQWDAQQEEQLYRQLFEVPRADDGSVIITEEGVRLNLSVAIQYIAAWNRGRGAVAIRGLMEDAATAEISRVQIISWLRHKADVTLANGEKKKLTEAMVIEWLEEELDKLIGSLDRAAYPKKALREAAALFIELMEEEELAPFFTTEAYEQFIVQKKRVEAADADEESADENVLDLVRTRWRAQQDQGRDFTRLHTDEQVAELSIDLQPEFAVENAMAAKLYGLLRESQQQQTPLNTVNQVQLNGKSMVRNGVQVIYVDGPESVEKLMDNPGADYSYEVMADPLSKISSHLAKLSKRTGLPAEQCHIPIILNIGAAHTVPKNMIETIMTAGTDPQLIGGIQVEDSAFGVDLGPLSGKVLVSASEQRLRLNEARFQLDLMRLDTLLIHGTRAMDAEFVTSDLDEVDQPFLLGATNPDINPYDEVVQRHWDTDKLMAEHKNWKMRANLMTLGEAVAQAIEEGTLIGRSYPIKVQEWRDFARTATIEQATARAKEIGINVFSARDYKLFKDAGLLPSGQTNIVWDRDLTRTESEGYQLYMIQGGLGLSVARGRSSLHQADAAMLSQPNAAQEDVDLWAASMEQHARGSGKAAPPLILNKLLSRSTLPKAKMEEKPESPEELARKIEQVKAFRERMQAKGRPVLPPEMDEQVARLRPDRLQTYKVQNYMANKLLNDLKEHRRNRTSADVIGAFDEASLGSLLLSAMKYRKKIFLYMGGWAESMRDGDPDQARYYRNRMAETLARFSRHLMQMAKKNTKLKKWLLVPFVVDIDTGHMAPDKMARHLLNLLRISFLGAVHIEDQLHAAKKCGHLSGKVLTPTRTQIRRIRKIRKVFWAEEAETAIVARTDAEAADAVSSTLDPRDHPFLFGATNPNAKSFHAVLQEARRAKIPQERLENLKEDWEKEARIMTLGQLIAEHLPKAREAGRTAMTDDKWKSFAERSSIDQMKQKAQEMGIFVYSQSQWNFLASMNLFSESHINLFWDEELTKTEEFGYTNYLVNSGTKMASARSKSTLLDAEISWMEQAHPDPEQAAEWAAELIKHAEELGLSPRETQNLIDFILFLFNINNASPSFKWSGVHHGKRMTRKALRAHLKRQAQSGIHGHFITYGGSELNHLAMQEFLEGPEGFWETGMAAFSAMQDRGIAAGNMFLNGPQKYAGTTYVSKKDAYSRGGIILTAATGKKDTSNQLLSAGGAHDFEHGALSALELLTRWVNLPFLISPLPSLIQADVFRSLDRLLKDNGIANNFMELAHRHAPDQGFVPLTFLTPGLEQAIEEAVLWTIHQIGLRLSRPMDREEHGLLVQLMAPLREFPPFATHGRIPPLDVSISHITPDEKSAVLILKTQTGRVRVRVRFADDRYDFKKAKSSVDATYSESHIAASDDYVATYDVVLSPHLKTRPALIRALGEELIEIRARVDNPGLLQADAHNAIHPEIKKLSDPKLREYFTKSDKTRREGASVGAKMVLAFSVLLGAAGSNTKAAHPVSPLPANEASWAAEYILENWRLLPDDAIRAEARQATLEELKRLSALAGRLKDSEEAREAQVPLTAGVLYLLSQSSKKHPVFQKMALEARENLLDLNRRLYAKPRNAELAAIIDHAIANVNEEAPAQPASLPNVDGVVRVATVFGNEREENLKNLARLLSRPDTKSGKAIAIVLAENKAHFNAVLSLLKKEDRGRIGAALQKGQLLVATRADLIKRGIIKDGSEGLVIDTARIPELLAETSFANAQLGRDFVMQLLSQQPDLFSLAAVPIRLREWAIELLDLILGDKFVHVKASHIKSYLHHKHELRKLTENQA